MRTLIQTRRHPRIEKIRSVRHTLRIYSRCKIHVCIGCHKFLRTFDGHHDYTGSYIRDDPVVVFAEDFEPVKAVFQSFKSKLRDQHLAIMDFSKMCTLTL